MDLALFLDLYELTMAQSFFIYKRDTRATFDLFVRSLPDNRSYLVACGLEDVLNYVRTLKFTKESLGYLRSKKLFTESFLEYLSGFSFGGDIWAMPEGTLFFAQEPVLRVTGSIIEAQIVESFLLNTINLQAMIASKAARITAACGARKVYDFSLRRTHGQDAGIKVSRSAYLAGFAGTSHVLAGKIYGIPIAGTMAHSFVMSFQHEIDSFLAYVSIFPRRSILLVDTYNSKKGIINAVTVGLYLKDKGYRLQGIRLDSGDMVKLSKFAREEFDRAGLKGVKIFATGNLDEFKIEDLLKRGAKIDSFGVGTNMGTSIDAPCLDVVYKISEVTDDSGRFSPTMKLSQAKVTYPGRKQVFRISKAGRYVRDVLGLEKEKIKGRPLLMKVVDEGKVIYHKSSLEKSRQRLRHEFARFDQRMQLVHTRYRYPVKISPGLKKLKRALSGQLIRRQ